MSRTPRFPDPLISVGYHRVRKMFYREPGMRAAFLDPGHLTLALLNPGRGTHMMSPPSESRLVWAASVARGARKVPLPCLAGRIVMASEALGQTTNCCRTAHSLALARSPCTPDVHIITCSPHARKYYTAPVWEKRAQCPPPIQISLCSFLPRASRAQSALLLRCRSRYRWSIAR